MALELSLEFKNNLCLLKPVLMVMCLSRVSDDDRPLVEKNSNDTSRDRLSGGHSGFYFKFRLLDTAAERQHSPP